MSQMILTNAKIVAFGEVFNGTIQVDGREITAVDQGRTSLPGAMDMEGDCLIPGLIELHTDNVEKHITPRPGVKWPSLSAVLAHDTQVVGGGITTVYDALSVGDIVQDSDRLKQLDDISETLNYAKDIGVLRADHYLHMRCEVSFDGVLDLFRPFMDNPMVRLVSVMDHAPGQRQFTDIDKYREYYQGKYKFSTEEMDTFIAQHKDVSARLSDHHRSEIIAMCKTMNLPLASHDDATEAHIDEAVEHGMVFSEFPTTMEAAKAARKNDLSVLMGAPNLVRGMSHSGNVSARELAGEKLLDIISSDYFPASSLHAIFTLPNAVEGVTLPQAVDMGTANPAQVAGLDDRGRIEVGRRADLVRVHETKHVPAVRETWCAGKRVF